MKPIQYAANNDQVGPAVLFENPALLTQQE